MAAEAAQGSSAVAHTSPQAQNSQGPHSEDGGSRSHFAQGLRAPSFRQRNTRSRNPSLTLVLAPTRCVWSLRVRPFGSPSSLRGAAAGCAAPCGARAAGPGRVCGACAAAPGARPSPWAAAPCAALRWLGSRRPPPCAALWSVAPARALWGSLVGPGASRSVACAAPLRCARAVCCCAPRSVPVPRPRRSPPWAAAPPWLVQR